PSDPQAVLAALDQRATTLLRPASPGGRAAAERIRAVCEPFALDDPDIDNTVDVTTRFMRTPSFLVRFVDLASRRSSPAIHAPFERRDGTGANLEDRIAGFAELVRDLTAVEREGLWEALRGVQTGSITTVTADFYDPGEAAARREATLPNVRLA